MKISKMKELLEAEVLCCEENIEKAKRKVKDRPDPKIIVPSGFLHLVSPLSFREIHPAGQALPHRPQPTQTVSLTTA